MISIIIKFDGNESEFLLSLENLCQNKLRPQQPKNTKEFFQLIILDCTNEFKESDLISKYINSSKVLINDNVICIGVKGLNFVQAANKAIDFIDRPFAVFLNSGDVLNASAIKIILDFYVNNPDDYCFISPNTNFYSRDKNKYLSRFIGENSNVVDLRVKPHLTPILFEGIVFKSELFKQHRFNEDLPYDYGIYFLYHILKGNPKFAWLKNAKYKAINNLESQKTFANEAMRPDWYWSNANGLLLRLFKNYKKTNNKIPAYLQYLSIYQLKWRFRFNVNNSNKHAIDDEVEEYFFQCGEILKEIDSDVLLNRFIPFELTLSLKDVFFRLKYENLSQSTGHKYEYSFFQYGSSFYLKKDNALIHNISNLKLNLELLEFENGGLIIEGSLDNYIDFDRCQLNAYFDGNPIDVIPTYRYAHTKYFGRSVNKRFTFKTKIDKSFFSKSLKLINFEVVLPNGQKIQPTILTKRYTSRLRSDIASTYWKSNGYLIRFTNNRKSIKIIESNLWNSLKAEIKHLKGMLIGANKYPQMFWIRCFYWCAYPFLKNKRVWLTFDKLYKAGDCGEYFYKYASKRSEKNIKVYYLINKDAPDLQRLRKEGYSPLIRGSLKQKIYFLYSEVIFATHTGVCDFNDFKNDQIGYFQDLIKFDVACIQHGLTVQDLAFDCNQMHNNIKRYYCASKYEIRNLSRPIYGYDDKSALKLTGIPRYDGLINNDRKQILITPTWRNYIAMPSQMGSSRPYNPDFKKTDYFKIYNNLINDRKLISTAKKFGYKLIYLLHPIVSVQVSDYEKNDGVELISALEVDYEKILTESSLMVTDYSGVQFDFAYMRKPIVYYHPDELPPHYKEGGFFYNTMGFGEICSKHDEIVDVICNYMKNNCAIKQLYKDREDDFFEFNDLNSSQRIYEDMIDFQNQKIINL